MAEPERVKISEDVKKKTQEESEKPIMSISELMECTETLLAHIREKTGSAD